MTITLQEALERATKGPMFPTEINPSQFLIKAESGECAGKFYRREDCVIMAHCRNELPAFVEAVEALIAHSESPRRDSKNELVRQKWALDNIVASELVKQALRSAQTVKMP